MAEAEEEVLQVVEEGHACQEGDPCWVGQEVVAVDQEEEASSEASLEAEWVEAVAFLVVEACLVVVDQGASWAAEEAGQEVDPFQWVLGAQGDLLVHQEAWKLLTKEGVQGVPSWPWGQS